MSMDIAESIILNLIKKGQKKPMLPSTGREAGLDVGIRAAREDLRFNVGSIRNILFVQCVKRRLLLRKQDSVGLIGQL